jgi:hypothetical protein
MARNMKKKAKAKKSTKRTVKKPKRAPAKKAKAKSAHMTVPATAGKPKEKSLPEVAAVHLENMAPRLGYHIPSAWWRHAS